MLYTFDIPNLITSEEINKLKVYSQEIHEKNLFIQPRDTDLNTLIDQYKNEDGSWTDPDFEKNYMAGIVASWNRNANNIAVAPVPKLPAEISQFTLELCSRYGASQGFFSMMRKNQDIVPHIDLEWRKTNILIPLSDNYAPLTYYDDNGNVLEEIHYENKIVMTNTEHMHGVKNNGYERFTYQISFVEDIETVYKKLNNA